MKYEILTDLLQVAAITGVAAEQICDKIRTSDIAFARHIFCWYAVKSGRHYIDVAALINRHRTSVTHSIQLIDGFIKIGDKKTLAIIEKLESDETNTGVGEILGSRHNDFKHSSSDAV
jgi:hypothetical protein